MEVVPPSSRQRRVGVPLAMGEQWPSRASPGNRPGYRRELVFTRQSGDRDRATSAWYSLAGPANANNIPFGGATEQNYAAFIHPATYIEIYVRASDKTIEHAYSSDSPVRAERITVSGHQENAHHHPGTRRDLPGPGATRIELGRQRHRPGRCWPPNSTPPDGLSGIDTTDLLRVAESLNT